MRKILIADIFKVRVAPINLSCGHVILMEVRTDPPEAPPLPARLVCPVCLTEVDMGMKMAARRVCLVRRWKVAYE